MTSIKLKFTFTALNIILAVLLFNYIPASTLVMISMIPALVYSIYTKRLFLVLCVVIVYASVISLFVCMMYFPAGMEEVGEGINLAVFLYRQLFPFSMSLNLIELIGVEVIFYVAVFVFLTFTVAWALKMNTFKIMLNFSYIILTFASLYLIVNLFLYLIPALRVAILENAIAQWFIYAFYGVLPFITFIFLLLYLETFWNRDERAKYKKTMKKFKNARNLGRLERFLKYTLLFIVIALILILINLEVIL